VKGVIIAAGYGTRFLPVTRCVPKEMLPIVDRPSIDFVVQEMVDAGVTQLLIITSRRKRVLDDWFDRDVELDEVFEREGATAKAVKAKPPGVEVMYTRQTTMRGTGHALLLAQAFAGSDPVVVAYPDDLFTGSNCTAELIAAYEQTGCSVMAAHDLSGQDVSRYGVLDADQGDGVVPIRGIVEKPAAGTEPSHLVSLGRYLYTPDLFPLLRAGWEAHDDGEFFPQDAINTLAGQGRVVAKVVSAERWDTGTPLGLLKASIEHALQRDDMGEDLREWLGNALR